MCQSYSLGSFLLFLCLFVPLVSKGQNFAVYDNFSQLEDRIKQSGDQTLVVNFWATWCKPCVEELPCFEELQQRYANRNVQVLLVSLDFKSQIEKRLIPFLQEKGLISEVVVLTDQDADSWIPRVHESWDGAIPVTVVIRGKQRAFHREKFKDFLELDTFVQPFLDSTAVYNTIGKR